MQPAIPASCTETASLKLKRFLTWVTISFALLWTTFLPIAFTLAFGGIWVYSLLFKVSLLSSSSKKHLLLHNNTMYDFFIGNLDGRLSDF